MKKAIILVVLMVFSVMVFVISRGGNEEVAVSAAGDIMGEVRELNTELDAAYLREDVNRLREILSEDHVHGNVLGMRMDRDRLLKEISEGVLKFDRYKTSGMEIRLFKDTCLVTGYVDASARRINRLEGVYHDTSSVRGFIEVGLMAPYKEVKGRFMYTRLYAKEGGRWRVKHFQNTRVMPEVERV